MTLRPCLDCGEPSPASRCDEHRPPDHNLSPTQRGYDSVWQRLSRRARRVQPWCTDCGTRDDLTCDHSPSAWERKAAGKVIRLVDVDVCCRPCNARRGRARPQGAGTSQSAWTPASKAKSPLHTLRGYA